MGLFIITAAVSGHFERDSTGTFAVISAEGKFGDIGVMWDNVAPGTCSPPRVLDN